jgi:hypothetical protein
MITFKMARGSFISCLILSNIRLITLKDFLAKSKNSGFFLIATNNFSSVRQAPQS